MGLARGLVNRLLINFVIVLAIDLFENLNKSNVFLFNVYIPMNCC